MEAKVVVCNKSTQSQFIAMCYDIGLFYNYIILTNNQWICSKELPNIVDISKLHDRLSCFDKITFNEFLQNENLSGKYDQVVNIIDQYNSLKDNEKRINENELIIDYINGVDDAEMHDFGGMIIFSRDTFAQKTGAIGVKEKDESEEFLTSNIKKIMKPKATEYLEFLNASNISAEASLLSIVCEHRDFLKKWSDYIIPLAKERYPFVNKFKLSTLGDIVYSHGCYFFSINAGWIDVDKDKYLGVVKN